jgi:hypothetical protein
MRKDYTEIVDRKNIDKKKSEYKNNALLKNKNLINFDFIYLTEGMFVHNNSIIKM